MRARLPFTLIFVLVVTLSTILTGAYFVSLQIKLKSNLATAQRHFLMTQFSDQVSLMLADHHDEQIQRYGLALAQKSQLDLLKVFNSHGDLVLNFEKNRDIGHVYKEEEADLLHNLKLHKSIEPMVYTSRSTQGKHIFLGANLQDFWSSLVLDNYGIEFKDKPTEQLESYGSVVMGFDLSAYNKDIFTDAMIGVLVIFFTIMLNLLVAFKIREWQQ